MSEESADVFATGPDTNGAVVGARVEVAVVCDSEGVDGASVADERML